MPDLAGKQRRSDSWICSGSPHDVIASVSMLATHWPVGCVVSQADGEVTMVLGSKIAFRLWGIFTPRRRVPVRVQVTVEQAANEHVKVEAVAISDPGWGVYEFKALMRRIYGKAFDELFEALHRLAPADPQR